MKKQFGYTLTEITILLVIIAGGWGWIWNIIKLATMSFDPITGMAVLRAIGIFVFPVGMVVGYL